MTGPVIFAIDTTTDIFCLALSKDGNMIDKKDIPGRRHSDRLITEIAALLKENSFSHTDIGVIGVGVGPGSFTGIRVGASVAITMAQFLEIPVYGISVLDLGGARHSDPVVKAFRDKYYHASYSAFGERESEYSIIDAGRVAELGAVETLINAEDMIRFIESRIASGDRGDWKSLEPIYVMATEYKPKKKFI